MSEYADNIAEYLNPNVPTVTTVRGFLDVLAALVPLVAPASPTAFTQTYATADTTVAAATVAAVATTAATQTVPFGYGSQAQADAIPVAINALTADVLQLRKLINKLIDIDQAAGLAS